MDARRLSEKMAVPTAEIISPNGGSQTESVLSLLRDYLHDGAAQRGLIPQSAVEAPDGKVESAIDPKFMDRVALAMVDMTHRVKDPLAEKGEREANVYERLGRAGCPIEVYLEMIQSPEFKHLLWRRSIEIIVFSYVPQIQSALSVKAAHGDDKSARLLLEIMRVLEVYGQDEIRMQYSRMDEPAMLRLMEDEARKTLEFIAQHRGDDLEIEPVKVTGPSTPPPTLAPVDLRPDAFKVPEPPC